MIQLPMLVSSTDGLTTAIQVLQTNASKCAQLLGSLAASNVYLSSNLTNFLFYYSVDTNVPFGQIAISLSGIGTAVSVLGGQDLNNGSGGTAGSGSSVIPIAVAILVVIVLVVALVLAVRWRRRSAARQRLVNSSHRPAMLSPREQRRQALAQKVKAAPDGQAPNGHETLVLTHRDDNLNVINAQTTPVLSAALPASLARSVVSGVAVPGTGANAVGMMKAVTVQLDGPGGGSAVLLLPTAMTTAIQGQMDAKDMAFFAPVATGTLEANGTGGSTAPSASARAQAAAAAADGIDLSSEIHAKPLNVSRRARSQAAASATSGSQLKPGIGMGGLTAQDVAGYTSHAPTVAGSYKSTPKMFLGDNPMNDPEGGDTTTAGDKGAKSSRSLFKSKKAVVTASPQG
jgi:hypothetical protein